MSKTKRLQVNTEKKTGRFRETIQFLRKPDFNQENSLIFIGKVLLFSLLVFFEIVIIAQHAVEWALLGYWWRIGLTVFIELILTAAEAQKLFMAQSRKEKFRCYVVDFVSSFLLVIITSSAFLSMLYLIILTEIYISTEEIMPATVVFAVCIPSYVALYSIVLFLQAGEQLSILKLFAQTSTAIVAFSLHFVIINFLMAFYRQYMKLERTIKELDESKKELQNAYDELEEATLLRERQRIAKDIHDTAGHSITTVIMQTEAAKLIIDQKPEEAKQKIISANLQAKNALEELRNSVHLLSGRIQSLSLREDLQEIVNDSSEGTGIKIRSSIQEINADEEQHRFICNTLKEGISNGLRHGNATAFWFELRLNEGVIEFLLSDNGAGAKLPEIKEGLGLYGMKERAERLGGEITFSSDPGEGFEIFLKLPHKSIKETGK